MKPIALLTDFGTVDGFVGVMKGVISSINPDVRIIDISHETSPYLINQAAYILWASYKFFPKGTIFVVVIDPGVGSDRRIILIEDENSYRFLIPENGLLEFLLPELKNPKAYHINNPKFWLQPVSSTFHGRDIFSPVAAYLSTGVPPEKLGDPVELRVYNSHFIDPIATGDDTYGKILHIDRFGNLISNMRVEHKRIALLADCSIQVGDRIIRGIKRNYAEGESGELLGLIGSSGLIEIAVRNGSAHQLLGLRTGDPVVLRKPII
jgi:S-adenosyl-L-methionine hydrolase (adenosine-forming)